MSTINNLMNDKAAMIEKITILDIDDLYTNPLNQAPIVNIDELAEVIDEQGLQTPLSVYKKENHHYVIINGERRYTALKQLGREEIPVIIREKPASEVAERLLILDANSQREETTQLKQERAKEYAELYLQLKQESKIPTGLLKIDWIGKHMNLSGRQVQRLLVDDANTSKEPKEKKPKEDLSMFDEIKDYLQDELHTKINFSKNKFTVSFDDLDDLKRILEIMGLEV